MLSAESHPELEPRRCNRCPAAGQCADCIRYSSWLAAARGRHLALPAGLNERLRAIASSESSADDATKVLARVSSAERQAHLRSDLAPSLSDRLRAIPHQQAQQPQRRLRPAGPPSWLAEGRYAAAVCGLLTAMLLTLAGDTSAHLQQASVSLEATSQRVAQQTQVRGNQLWQHAATLILETGVAGHRQLAASYTAALDRAEQWRAAVLNELSNTRLSRWLDSAFSPRGDDDGHTSRND